MTAEIIRPVTLNELQEMVSTAEGKLLPRGHGSKPALSAPPEGVKSLGLDAISGLLEYNPSEFTFTALAGTPVADIERALDEHDQYLPFDPLFVQAGATLGGTVAANANGPGRYRYGGVRDFILGIRYVNGEGQTVQAGGKVVKNAAGFDLSKLMVGSRGGLAALYALTFKVFPKPEASITLQKSSAEFRETIAWMQQAANTRLEPISLEIATHGNQYTLLVRLAGLKQALQDRSQRLIDTLGSDWERTEGLEEELLWKSAREMEWAPASWNLIKVPITPSRIPNFEMGLQRFSENISKARQSSVTILRHYGVGGQIAWLAFEEAILPDLENLLISQNLAGLSIRRSRSQHIFPGKLQLGKTNGDEFLRRVKSALDPAFRFWYA
jgi:glycolate oxidase FAD binding subunit